MERSELALVPEWLRSSGSLPGGGSSTHHFPSSSNSDAALLGHHNINRTSRDISGFNTPLSPFLDHSASSNSRRSSNTNGYGKHAYSSFGRSHRERDKDREKERPTFGDHWDCDCPNLIGTIFPRVENDTLRPFQSRVTRKRDELVQRKVSLDSKLDLNNNHYNGNGTHLGVHTTAGSVRKLVFEKDFPSLANEERQGGPEIGRVPSPGPNTAVQSLHVSSNSTLIGEGWRSALVEVPSLHAQQNPLRTPGSGATNTGSGLNMAEALAQAAPSQANTVPLLSVTTQKVEELAIKQSRQLIPVTPTTPKTLVHNSSDKLKPKLGARSSEVVSAAKNGQQQPLSLHPVNQPQPVGNVKSDASKTSHGKFLVLKPVRENGISAGPRDISTSNVSSRIANSGPSLTVSPSLVASTSSNSQNSPKHSTFEGKSLNPGCALEKRPSLAQSQSRKDFLNLMRKKTSMKVAPVLLDSGLEIPPLTVEKSSEEVKEVVSPLHTAENCDELTSNGSTSGEFQRYSDLGEQNLSMDIEVYPDEEEAAFLRSLGWEENAGEDEGLTEEEINSFYQEYMKLRPSLKLCGSVLPKLGTLTEFHATTEGSSNSDSEV